MKIHAIKKLPAEAFAVGAEYNGHMIVGRCRGRWRLDFIDPRAAEPGMQAELACDHPDSTMLLFGGSALLRLHTAEDAADVEAIALDPASWARVVSTGHRWHVAGGGLTGGTLRDLWRRYSP